ncbi:hypothetical protein EVAR_52364_1 [Eumeta japonica]|uniref:Neutral/alkaline non-lysosomal ceramidase C-terminal domain-containing protein n=1 Tax=Eumeta variegata TaxID=151549 RepID=A0A4C1YUH7_EUMVA|nr:hypothetical protein EVAR_52364_1 [Eumeta japonica]
MTLRSAFVLSICPFGPGDLSETECDVQGAELGPGPTPGDHSESLISLVPPVLWDAAAWGHEFGDCVQQPRARYARGETVVARFIVRGGRLILFPCGRDCVVRPLSGRSVRRSLHGRGGSFWSTRAS